MSGGRTKTEIDADIAAHTRALKALRAERKAAAIARRQSIVAAFDRGGLNFNEIAYTLGVPLGTVGNVLARANRRARVAKIPMSHMPPETQRLYNKLRAAGIGPEAARQMATAGPASAAPREPSHAQAAGTAGAGAP